MLTESEARELLARAAATVDVAAGDTVPVPPPRRRRWLVPAIAAVATVAMIAAGAALIRDEPNAGAPPATGPHMPNHVNPAPGRMPSVFAYDARSAEEMLSQRGLVVTTKPSYTCDTSGRAVRTSPAAGTRFVPGDAVRLFVTAADPLVRCPLQLDSVAWQVLDFANHRGPAPAFAPEVSVYVNGQYTSLTGRQAGDSATWGPGSALSLLAASSRQELHSRGLTITPSLTVHTDDGTQYVCGGLPLPSEFTGRESLLLSMGIPFPGIGIRPECTFGSIFQSNGRIDAIVVRTSSRLQSEGDPDPDGIGARFLAYARGETDELPVDTAVRLYLGNEYQKTINAPDLADRTSWDVCAAYAGRSCPMSAVETLRAFVGEPIVEDSIPPGSSCPDRIGEPPTDTGGTRFVVLVASGISSCIDYFAVQIWSNDVGQITAVNLLLGSP